jgi:cystathionine gamma-lyase/cystathionine beta-lyase/cystathionine gamma-lyase/homocysteine desulfhydrase
MAKSKPAFATLTVHGGQSPDPTTGAVMPPIYQTSTYRQPGLGADWPYDYARTINPTRLALERNLATLEGGLEARCFASGMAAIHAVLHLVRGGDHVVVSRNVYGGTYRLFEGVLRSFGVGFTWADTSDLRATEAAVTPATRMLFVETPTNPVLALTDISGAAAIARRRRIILVVDNTFMSPMFQQPLSLGADVVVHSTTKYLNGHSDSVGGCVVVKRKKHAERIAFVQKSVGSILGPMDSYLTLRGIKTLALRMECHDRNGRQVARWLDGHRAVQRVHYPGLPSHPQRALAKRQMSGFGGMVSFDLGRYARARKFLGRLKLATLGESLGGVETLVSHPASMTHAAMPPEERAAIGVTDSLVRISVGIEEVEDIVADLDQGLRGL